MNRIPDHDILKFEPNALEEIRKCYNLDQKRMAVSIDILEEWIKKQEHLIKKDFSRNYLELSIICCKGSVEKAKLQIDRLCTLKTLLPCFFSNFDINTNLKSISEKIYHCFYYYRPLSFRTNGNTLNADRFQPIYRVFGTSTYSQKWYMKHMGSKISTREYVGLPNTLCAFPLPKMTKSFERVFFIKINTNNITPTYFFDYYRLLIVICEYLKVHDYVNGFIIIYDLRMVHLMDILTNLNTSELQHIITILPEGYGARLLAIHLITTSKVVDVFIKTIKSFFKPKIADRIQVHSSVEDIHAFVDKSILPVDYGGDERSVEELTGIWYEELGSKKHLDLMRMMSAACTDESRRQTSLFNEEYLGMPGTFRSLNVD